VKEVRGTWGGGRTMPGKWVAVVVDAENPAGEWWDALRGAYPNLARALEGDGHAIIETAVWRALESLPGWDDGPVYARNPLVDRGGTGHGWADIVAARHQVFGRAE
jgi:hypothetical protein